MPVLIIIISIAVPLIMVYMQPKWVPLRYLFNMAAIVTGLVFVNISAISVYNIIRDQTVFMTKIHAVFLNPFFLATGAYLGIFFLYRLLLLIIYGDDKRSE